MQKQFEKYILCFRKTINIFAKYIDHPTYENQ